MDQLQHLLFLQALEKFGLQSALEELVDEFNMSKKVLIDSNIEYPRERLSSTQELHVFRIVQEPVNNSVRHGKAKKIDLDFMEKDEEMALNYKDNGIGFSQDETQEAGLGLKNIENRAHLIGAKAKLISAPKEGPQLVINYYF